MQERRLIGHPLVEKQTVFHVLCMPVYVWFENTSYTNHSQIMPGITQYCLVLLTKLENVCNGRPPPKQHDIPFFDIKHKKYL